MLYLFAAVALAGAFVIAWLNYRYARRQRLYITNERFLVHGLLSAFTILVGVLSATALIDFAIEEQASTDINKKELNARQQRMK